jgi:hypothetical protein
MSSSSSSSGNNSLNLPCFSLGPILGLSHAQYQNYRTAWFKFNDVLSYNARVSTIIGSNPRADVSYYRFANNMETQQYRQGQALHSIVYPASNWNSIGSG